VVLRPPLSMMTAVAAAELPDGPEGRWAWEPKFDGWRAIAFRNPGGRVQLQSRQQRSLTRYFPDVTAALAEQLDHDVVLDGELVVALDGRLDFAALQRRLRRGAGSVVGASACLVAFDVLALDGHDLRRAPYHERAGPAGQAAGRDPATAGAQSDDG
jgi:ATP-dependent DNA ligase